jgi:hypothetical protein
MSRAADSARHLGAWAPGQPGTRKEQSCPGHRKSAARGLALGGADQHFRSKQGGIAFGTEQDQRLPGYRDFAYVAVIVAGTVNLVSGLFR